MSVSKQKVLDRDLTPEEVQKFRNAIGRTWTNIAGDSLALNNGKPFTRQEVLEMCVDYVYRDGGDKEVTEMMVTYRNIFDLLEKHIKTILPFARYG